MYISQNYLTMAQVKVIQKTLQQLGGVVPEGKLLIVSPKAEDTKVGSIIIPGTNKEDMPRKGVVVQQGEFPEDLRSFKDITSPGRIITYGLYAGKVIDFNHENFPLEVRPVVESSIFTILSTTEVAYTESNPK